jgi:hypothetical protein
MRLFRCLVYVHLQKDQCSALLPHATQCILIGYLSDYKGWKFWDPAACKEIISDSAVFHKSIFPFHKPGLSGVDTAADSSCCVFSDREPATPSTPVLYEPLVPNTPGNPDPDPVPGDAVATPCLVMCVIPPVILPAPPVPDLPKCPHTPLAVRQLTSNFEHHPSLGDPLPGKWPSGAHVPGALAEANAAGPVGAFTIPLVDAMEFALSMSAVSELRTLEDALKRPDVDKWVVATLVEIEAHMQNGTWELAQLPPRKRAIGS